MPNRIIKESICKSEQIDEMGWFEEAFFYRLIVNCDDYGVMDGRPKILRAQLMPLKDGITLEQIQSAVNTLLRLGLARKYTVKGKPYIQLIKWSEHQRVRDSKHKYPGPEEADEETYETELETSCGDSRRVAASCSELQRVEENGGEPQQDAASCGSRAQPRAGAESESESEYESEYVGKRACARETDADFDRFWAEYPNKVKKPNAKRAWDKLKPEAELVSRIMQGLARWKQSDQWTRDDGRFIPHPATWLNGRQWEDEVQPRRAINAMSAHNFPERDYSNEDEEARQRMYEMLREEKAMMG